MICKPSGKPFDQIHMEQKFLERLLSYRNC